MFRKPQTQSGATSSAMVKRKIANSAALFVTALNSFIKINDTYLTQKII
jgi:hypothetical protein